VLVSAERGCVRQGTYALAHPTLGARDVFLVLAGPSRDGRMQHETIFN
jgi:hypothetical protein